MPKLALGRLDPLTITHAPQLESGLRPSIPSLLAEVLKALPEPVYLKDRSHRWVMVNDAYCDYMGRTCGELLGNSESDILPEREAVTAWENDEAVFKTGSTVINEAVATRDDKTSRVLQTDKSLLRDGNDNELLLCVIRDLTGTDAASALLHGRSTGNEPIATSNPKKIRRLGEQPVRFALSDSLTQLPDRRAIMNLLDAAAAQVSRRSAIFVINIDHFKLVNDRFGHTAGDTVILEVARRLRASIRSNDILGRLDGDEFIVMADAIDPMEADRIVDKILADIVHPMKLGQHEYRISVSVGIAMFSEPGHNAEELVRNARMAAGWCKRRSRGGSEFYSDGASVAAERMATIELKLPVALEQGDLVVHYQPIVASRNRAVSGFEALVRWHDSELGELAPEEFIPIAEDMGIVRRMGQMIIDQACGFTASLIDPRMSVAVNVSGSQLMDETFPIFVAETLQKFDLTGDRLFFEITESVAMEADASVWQVFEELATIGVRLIIDDFGTGFSNLARLKELPFVAIKIDRDFIRDLPNSPQDRAIFRAMHAIAKELKLKTVAEGIENALQEEFVARFGVDYFQGYRFGHPMPANKLKRYTRL